MNYFEFPLCEFLLLVSVTCGGEVAAHPFQRGLAELERAQSLLGVFPGANPQVPQLCVDLLLWGGHRSLFYLCVKGWSKGRTVSKELSLVLF